jgi:hypothetical protein
MPPVNGEPFTNELLCFGKLSLIQPQQAQRHKTIGYVMTLRA